MDPRSEAPIAIDFGRFRVLPHRREVLAEGRPLELGGRAFDVLMALIDASGEVVSKDALMDRAWPDRIVEENNLQAQISALRKALAGDRTLIRTVAGRGYQFTGVSRTVSTDPDAGATAETTRTEPTPSRPPTNLPEPVSELIGRDAELAAILNLIGEHRLVTLAGAGGIGKTRLALAGARRLRQQFPDGVWLAEFSPLADPNLVPATVAAAVGLQLGAGEISPQRVSQALAGRHLLLILDTCEHVIEAAAAMAEALLQAGAGVRILATSREPLRAEGERIYPVPPLAVPVVEGEDQWQFGAVLLFVARSRASGAHVGEDQPVARVIASICRQLDGIPLAIELAAARAATLGVEGLVAGLEDRFHLLTGGRRTALPRHQTLQAMLDWSYQLLTEPERVVLRRLAVFAGPFSLAAARAVVASPEIPPSDVVDKLSDLVAKSLVVADVEGSPPRHRLLDTTRAYALEKLDESGERERLLHHHAEYYRQLFERAEVEWETRPTVEWLDDYVWCIDNLRAALDWAFSPKGDTSIGIALTAAAVPLWMHLSLLDECRSCAEQALAACKIGVGGDPRREMKLYTALATSSFWGPAGVYARIVGRELGALWTKALEIAESLDDVEYQLRSLWGLYVFHLGIGDFQIALEIAQRFRTLAAKQRRRNDELVGERMMGFVQHLLGDQVSARRHTEHMLANFIRSDQRSHEAIRFNFDQRVAARICLARILWLQGFPDEAMRIAKGAVDEAHEINHAISLCYALALATCPIMLWVEDLAAAERYIAMLLDYSARYAVPSWGALGRTFQEMLAIRRGDFGSGLGQLRVDFEKLGAMPEWVSMMFLNELAAGFARAGQIADGLAAAEQAIERAERTEARWLFPESLRIRDELLLLQAATGAAAAAEDHFRQALDWARRQGALSLELRAATSLARLLRDQGNPADARAVLQPVYDRFTEGFDTADLKAAKALLDALK
jgi:predicted ATPase/DNA-binding winged helix-turn-helix (wHTH) protein